MNPQELRDIAKRLLDMADALEAEIIEANARELARREPVQRSGNGSIFVNLPGPDLFSEMEREAEAQRIQAALPEIPQTRTYNRVAIPMQDGMNVNLSGRVRKADGFCQRSDIERTMVRNTGETREAVRDAINAAAAALRLTCFRCDGYRYYRIIDRAPLMERAEILLSKKTA